MKSQSVNKATKKHKQGFICLRIYSDENLFNISSNLGE